MRRTDLAVAERRSVESLLRDPLYNRSGRRWVSPYEDGRPSLRRLDYADLPFEDRPTYVPSQLLANPDFGNFRIRRSFTTELWLQDGETVAVLGDGKEREFRTHYSPMYRRPFFSGWIGRLLQFLALDRLFGLHIDSHKKSRTRSVLLVTAKLLPLNEQRTATDKSNDDVSVSES
ncbi:Type II secretion system (T2SS)-related protein GspDL [Andalucia godoyi]|uniref:Type II secretion system (T2SS)-related protein GspDL n=1 Tax=Andalucia godoyi TaxID=505711 RepID=A0A8K0AIT2_ANDGO|nr:Type II secretion system (T2SS)-related protein GspDL [Andalucia godoyi]|eukprot:ANDGO_02519.mRNA.1 Type II secretion system (T2SS)-related protein GspDL